MPRPKRNATRPVQYDDFETDDENSNENSNDDNSEGSDFEDPDEIEVPGGGKNLKIIQELKGGDGEPSKASVGPVASTSSAPVIGVNKNLGIRLKGDVISARPGKSLLKTSQTKQPPLIDLSEEDNGLEIVKEITNNIRPGNALSSFGMPNMVTAKSLLGGAGFNRSGFSSPYTSPSLSMAQDPFVGSNPTDLLQKSMRNGGLAHILRAPYFPPVGGGLGSSSNVSASPYNQMSGGGMYGGAVPPSGAMGAALQSKQISNLWMQGNPTYNIMQRESQEDEEVAAEDEDDMGVIETYSNYMPAKLKIGQPHPDPVVETASMASVEPPNIWYNLHLPDEVIDERKLSALQLETVVYASQQHEQILEGGKRAGFLIGDGAGVGKGRTIAGIIYENFIRGRKRAIWVSVSNDLKYDAERDLRDIGAGHINVHFLSKMKYAKINSSINNHVKSGVIYATYSALIGESQAGGKYKSRLKQLTHWCGEDFDGCIVFDECHRAKNLCPTGAGKPTKTGQTVLQLQNDLPNARIVYASATGASEPKHMAYMVRLGIWGPGSPFKSFNEFLGAVEKRGVGAMEIVAMDMKLRGMYIARQLSFQGVGFRIDEVELNTEFRKIYDKSVDLWVDLLHKFEEAASLVEADKKMRKTMWGQFWSSHQRFFKYLCIASKVGHVIKVATDVIKLGKCVVIGLQSTGEARTMEALEREEELTDFVSTAKGVLQSLVEKHFPAPDREKINRILRIGQPKSFLEELGMKVHGKGDNGVSSQDTSTSNGKRKKRQAAQKKRVKLDSTIESSGDSGSDFEPSDHDEDDQEDDDEFIDDEDEEEEDFNPFGSGGSDEEEDDPWSKRRKKKVAKKKPQLKKTVDPFIQLYKSKQREENNTLPQPPPPSNVDRACQMKADILKRIEKLGNELPANTLDQLIDELGGPDYVSEMTGRKGRVVQAINGDVRYESRSEQDIPLETLNLTEKDRFMRGDKNVAIISEAASSGISLQADRRVLNKKRRVHLTLELPWSADRAIQQFGRTHRSNQVSAPEYILLISDLAGEHRFASIVAKRLESLGALTHGDRRATESRDLSRFNIDNKYGRSALEATFRAIMGYETPLVPPPSDYNGDFFKDIADGLVGVGLITQSEDNPGMVVLDKGHNDMSKFLNRILGMKVDLQNMLFKYFSDTLNAIISQAKRSGRYDQGILDVGLTEEDNVELVKTHTFETEHSTGKATIKLHVLTVERGLSWDNAKEKWEDLEEADEGFYLSHQIRSNKKTAILAIRLESKKKESGKKKERLFIVYRPNTGQQVKHETLTELRKKYKKVSPDEAEPHWNDQFRSSAKKCSHAYWKGNCKNVNMGLKCEVGLRRKTYNVLAGSVLSVWNKVEQVLTYDGNRKGSGSKMQVVRLKLENDKRIVGTLIPCSAMSNLLKSLRDGSEEAAETIY